MGRLKSERWLRVLVALGLCVGYSSASAHAMEDRTPHLSVTYENGLVSVDCEGVRLAQVLERMAAAIGVTLFLEESATQLPVSARLEALPPATVIAGLLEGSGLNYVLMWDPVLRNGAGKLYVGAKVAAAVGTAREEQPSPRDVPTKPDLSEIEARLDIPALFATPQGQQALRKLEELARQRALKEKAAGGNR